MRPIAATAAAVLTSALAAVPSAAAAAPWSAPQPVPGSQQASPFTVGVSLGRGARGVVGFSINPTPELLDSPQTGAIAGYARGGPLAPEPIAPYDLAVPAVAYRERGAIVVQRRTLDRERAIVRLAVSVGRPPATVGARQVLDTTVKLRDVAVAANANGDAAIAWTADKGYRGRRANNDRLYLSLRRAGGRFGKPAVLVGSGKLASVSAGYGLNGDLVVAFERQAIDRAGTPGPRRVQARVRPAGGRFGPIDDLGLERGVTDIVTQVAANGRAYVAWGTQDGGIEANGPFEVYAATKSATASRFRAAGQLFRGKGRSVDRPQGHLSMAIDRSGADAVLAFTGVGDGGPQVGTLQPVLVSSTHSDGRFGLPRLVSGGNGAVGGIVVQPGGRATVVWTGLKPGLAPQTTGVFASTRTSNGFRGTPEVVSATAPVPTTIPSIALPAAGGAPVVAWYEGPATGVLTSRRG